MVVLITSDDLAPFADIAADKAQAMIEDATAMALRVAPCLSTTTDDAAVAAARAILRAAILRWNDSGSGEVTQQTSGAFTTTYTQTSRKSMFWPTEVEQLQQLCQSNAGRAFELDTMPSNGAGNPPGHWSTPTTWVWDL